MVSVFLALLDLAEIKDIERIVMLLFEHGSVEIAFQCINLLVQNGNLPSQRDELITQTHFEAINRHQIHVSMQLMILYNEIMLENDHRVLAPIIDSLRTSSFMMDLKLAMIK